MVDSIRATNRRKSPGEIESLENYEHRFILYVISLGVVFGSLFAILAYLNDKFLDAGFFFGLVFAAASGICAQVLFGLNRAMRCYYTLCLLTAFFYLVVVGGVQQTGLFGSLAITPAFIAVLGFRRGAILFCLMALLLWVIFSLDLYLFPERGFDALVEVKFLGNFIGLSLFAIGLDYSRFRMQNSLLALNRSMNEIAHRDQLTGLANRREMDRRLLQLWNQYRSTGEQFSVILCDVDNFKSFNDNYGHDLGDQIIARVGQRLQNALRGEDLVARWGGDEFLVLLPGQGRRAAGLIGERLRQRVAATALEYSGQQVNITLSAGAACADSAADVTDLLKQADAGLYQAKNMGKDRLVQT